MSPWKEFSTADEVHELLESYGYFHDGCLREVHIVTNEYVHEDLAMNFDGQLTATLLIQRQWKEPAAALELRFVKVRQFNFLGPSQNYNNLIFEATLSKIDGVFYWADDGAWQPGDNGCVWISGERLFWRARPDLLGQVSRLIEEPVKQDIGESQIGLRKVVDLANDFEFWRGHKFRLLNDGRNLHQDDHYFDYILTQPPWEKDFMMLVNVTANSHKAGAVYGVKISIDKSYNKSVVTKADLLEALGPDAKNFYLAEN